MYTYLKDKTVLYIEDESDVRDSVSELLSDSFGAFFAVSSAEEGYVVCKTTSIDMLLVDIELPHINGLEFIETIRQSNSVIPIIIISAYTKTEYLLKSIELNLIQYIVKPLNSKKINTLLEKFNEYFVNDIRIELASNVWLNKQDSTVYFDNEIHDLTKREYLFLSLIAQNSVVYYAELDTLWDNRSPSENAIRSFVKNLRKKLPQGLLKNRNGYGYYIKATEYT